VTTTAASDFALAGADTNGLGARIRWLANDVYTIAWRYIVAIRRQPETMFFSVVQPIMLVLLFRYVYGGAIHVKGSTYIDYLMPGVFVQTVAFGSVSTAVGLAEDIQKGLIERFRALPMARSAVLTGRTVADFGRNIASVAIMTGLGFLVGFRIHTNVGAFLAGLLVLLLLSWVLSWGFALIGLSAPNSETANIMAFPILFPFVFASSGFVPVQTMPGWLQAFAKNQPISRVINAARELMGGGPTATDTWLALAWCVGLLLVFIPLAVHKYLRTE
jgi:ABC-2 type transport system permease protein/oleandomycin transport system permease protein